MNKGWSEEPGKSRLIILLIFLLALFLRLYDLGGESIWLDEAASISFSKGTLFQVINRISGLTYNICLYFWIRLFGSSEVSARLPSAIFGSLVVFMIYKVGRSLFNKKTGMASSLLAGLSIFYIQYSQEARSYILTTLLTLVSMYFFIRLLEKRKLCISIGYMVSNILLLYAHPFAILIPLVQNLYFFTLSPRSNGRKGNSLKIWLFLQLPLFIYFFQGISSYVAVFYRVKETMVDLWIPRPAPISILVSFLEFSGSLSLMVCFFISSLFSLLIFEKIRGKLNFKIILGSLADFRWNMYFSDIQSNYFLILWLFFPILALFIFSVFFIPSYWTRYLIISSPAFYLLAGHGISNLKDFFTKLILLTAIVVFSLINIHSYWRDVNKEPWRDAAGYVQRKALPKDSLIFIAPYARCPFDYYFTRKDVQEIATTPDPGFIAITGEKIRLLNEIIGAKERVWVILYHYRDPRGLLKEYFSSHFQISVKKDYSRARFLNLKFQNFINTQEIAIEVYLLKKK